MKRNIYSHGDAINRVEQLRLKIEDAQREIEMLQKDFGMTASKDDRKVIVQTMIQQLEGWTTTSDLCTEGKIRQALFHLKGLV